MIFLMFTVRLSEFISEMSQSCLLMLWSSSFGHTLFLSIALLFASPHCSFSNAVFVEILVVSLVMVNL